MENVVSVIFKVNSEAYQAFSTLKKNMITNDYVISQMALLQKENGRLAAQDVCDSGINTTDDTRRGGLIGMLIGVWTGPLGMLLCGSYGALFGSIHDSKDAIQNLSMMELVGNRLEDGDTALVLLASEVRESGLNTQFSAFDTEIIRYDAAVVSQELDDAVALQKELEKEARQKSRESKKQERKADIEARRSKIKEAFASLKGKTE